MINKNDNKFTLNRVEPYSWGLRDYPVLLVINTLQEDNYSDNMLIVLATSKGHEGGLKYLNLNDNIAVVFGNLKDNIIYWDTLCLRNAFLNQISAKQFEDILEYYPQYTHKIF